MSRAAQLRDIEASFAACNDASQFDLSTVRHPNKQGVTAAESFEIFPDVDIWANAYDLFRFSERPGDKPMDVCGRCSVDVLLMVCRWKTLDWIVRFCGPWSRMGITFCRIILPRTMSLRSSSRRDAGMGYPLYQKRNPR